MFASLKSKIKEETGSDIGKLTSSWRSGAFLGRISLRDESSTASPSSSGREDSTSSSISPQLEAYLSDRTGGSIDQAALHQQYTNQLEAKLQERDVFWEHKIDELKTSLATVQSEEAIAAQSVARAAQAEAAKAASERDLAEKQLNELRTRLASAELAQDKLDALMEELEEARREWVRERTDLTSALAAANARTRDLADDLAVVKAALPPENSLHHMHEDDKQLVSSTGCTDYDRLSREKAVLTRQLQEAKMALDDVKTSWSGQIATLETQVARLSRQAGEEGAERRRVEKERKDLQDKLVNLMTELEKTKQNLANSDAKVVRLNGEVHSLAMEVKSLRNTASHAGEIKMDLENQIQALTEENQELVTALDNEKKLIQILQEKLEKSNRLYDEQKAEVIHLKTIISEMQKDLVDIQKSHDKQKSEKDEALLRNAQIAQTMEISQCNVRYQEAEITELRCKIGELESLLAQHKENQATCMLIKEEEKIRKVEIEHLKKRIDELNETGKGFKNNIQDLENELCDKNKKIKTLDNRISDMKKTLQRELQSSKSDLNSVEEQDISRRYLKHVVLKFLTARELEAKQLTRALSVLLRLTAHEEAMLRSSLHPRTGISTWFPSITNT